MKKLFFSLVALTMAAMSYAQNTLVATLTHGDEISMFYGVSALQNAHAAAANGDIINLSGGSFYSINITKAVTIRGTGVLDAFPTKISGDFSIKIPSTVNERLSFEGCIISDVITVECDLSNAYFLKDNLSSIRNGNHGKIINGTFLNCNIYDFSIKNSSTAQFINSYVSGSCGDVKTNSSASFINCIVRLDYTSDDTSNMGSVQLINSIIYTTYYIALPSSYSAWNCVAVGVGKYWAFEFLTAMQNCTSADMDIFNDENVMQDLTDEAKATYLGTDGTPVGMYGGVMPYNLVPTYPRITKMNVASKTTADGKLSVEIEVSAAE